MKLHTLAQLTTAVLSVCIATAALAQTCETWLQEFGTTDLIGGRVWDSTVYDDGGGDSIYVAGDFSGTAEGDAPLGAVSVWRDSRWQPLGDGGLDLDQPFAARAVAVFDDGRGDALYVAGGFGTVDGVEMNSIVRWNGRTWEDLAGGVYRQDAQSPGFITAMSVFDDGSGAKLYVWGSFDLAGGLPVNNFACWDGTTWIGLSDDLSNGSQQYFVVYDLEVFDDGNGPALYAGGSFSTDLGHLTSAVAKWNGIGWEALAEPLPTLRNSDRVFDLHVADFGVGESLFVAGDIEAVFDEQVTEGVIAWTGQEWRSLGLGLAGQSEGNTTVYALGTTSFEGETALYAGGLYNARWLGAGKNISRWDGTTWSPLDYGVRDRVYSLLETDPGPGPRLLVFGQSAGSTFVTSPNMIAWDGVGWESLSRGFVGWQVTAVTTFTDDIGPALFAGTTNSNFSIARSNEFGWIGYPEVRRSASSLQPLDIGSGEQLFAAFRDGGSGEMAVAVLNGMSWETVGTNILNGGVTTVESFDSGNGPTLFAGGAFTGSWGALSSQASVLIGDDWLTMPGISGPVRDWAVFDDGTGEAIYAAGEFDTLNGDPYRGVLRWDGAAWEQLAGGLNWHAYALQVYDSGNGPELYAGGRFFLPGNNGNSVGMARWTGAAWEPVSDGLGTGARVYDLHIHDDGTGLKLYAAGSFGTADGQPARGIARWDGNAWEPVGTGAGANGDIRSLATFDDGSGVRLAAGGTFTAIEGIPAPRLAVWDGTSWDALGGTDGYVFALEVYDHGNGPVLYAGGTFDLADGTTARGIAAWNGVSWDAVGTLDNRNGPDVYTLEVFDNGTGPMLFAGGRFTSADGQAVQNIAAWNGTEWTRALAANNNVRSLVSMQYQGQTILGAGGDFWLIGGESFTGIAQLDTSGEWVALDPGGVNGSVASLLAVVEDGQPHLYAGGNFLAPGEYVARYDGTQWQRLGDGLNDQVLDLEQFDDGSGPAIYAAGEFTSSGGVTILRIARWNGVLWEPVGAGIDDGVVHDLAVHNGPAGPWLVASGSFTSVGGVLSRGVAVWDGSMWIPFDPGINGTAFQSATADSDDGPVLIIAGDFSIAGDTVAGSLAAWGVCPPEPCIADFNSDGSVNTLDVLAFLNAWTAGDMTADINGDGDVNTLDVLAFLNAWNAGCP
ncbi:hypothetical protein JYT82_00560 [bacterium AH-315-K20]|nr:hypothetical protein [bacterium AH-315-K20]